MDTANYAQSKVVSILCAFSIFLLIQTPGHSEKKEDKKMTLEITSPAFSEGGKIPKKYTCDGEDISPPLRLDNVPEETKSLALLCDDPDAPVGTWVHWVLYDLPPDTRELPENIPPDKELKKGGVHGNNSWKRLGYGGPCPPSGTHRYFFKFYALDKKLDLKPGATAKQVQEAMKGHVLAEGKLMGKYARS
jgi:hypothetical protein